MNRRLHIHLGVKNLEKSTDFYQKFFGQKPEKLKEGYVKFLPNMAPLNVALTRTSEISTPSRNGAGHLGIEMESSDIVEREHKRIRAVGLSTREEKSVNCCHANQDKFWVEDPDGISWEIYHVNHDI